MLTLSSSYLRKIGKPSNGVDESDMLTSLDTTNYHIHMISMAPSQSRLFTVDSRALI